MFRMQPDWSSRCLVGAMLVLFTSSCGKVLADDAPAAASDEAKLAIDGFRVPEGFQVEVAAAEPQMENPVAFCFDEQGRIFVAETFRQDHGVTDNRGHMNWLEDDLSLQTVEERGEMFRRYLGKEVDDWEKYEDRIRRLEDRDGDGRYETATVFAGGFNDILDGTGAGVLARQGNVYYTCIPKLWLLNDANDDGQADVRTPLHHGYGVRVAFRGHDMHGLVFGPDGRLYFSIGDRGYNVTTPEGTQLKRPDTGAVFRCEPDGSKLEVYAYGLRNPQELAFNDEGDLFTGDNNSDGGDQARWVYVTPQSDAGWRMYYQYLSDRGPWNREQMWRPYRHDEHTTEVQPAFHVPPIRNFADGPSGLVFDPGVGLPEHHRGRFFLVDFRGSPGGSGVRSFRVAPKGAGYEMQDDEWFVQSILATDVDFGYDGAIYVADWVDGWTGIGKGRIYRFKATDQTPDSAAQIFRDGFRQRTDDDLFGLLGHADRRVRLEAQYELSHRAVSQLESPAAASPIATELYRIASTGAQELPARHAVWAVGQIARLSAHLAGDLKSLVEHPSADVRRQAWRVIADIPSAALTQQNGFHELLEKGLADAEPRVRFEAAIAAGRHGDSRLAGPLLKMLADNQDEDPYLRHAAVVGLAGAVDGETLLAAADQPSKSARLGIVLALRRLLNPAVAQFLNDHEMAVSDEAARAIHDLNLADAMPALAGQVRTSGFASRASTAAGKEFVRRAVNANYRIGGEAGADAVALAAAEKSLPDDVRVEAAQDLLDWAKPPRLDRVTGEFRPIAERSQDEATAAVRRVLPSLLAGSNELREAGVQIAARYGITDVGPTLITLAKSAEASDEVRSQALRALSELKNSQLASVVDELLKDSAPVVRAEARRTLAALDPGRAVKELSQTLLDAAALVEERQSAVTVLGTMKGPEAESVLSESLQRWIDGTAPAADIQLDLVEAAKVSDAAGLKALASAVEAARPADTPAAAYSDALEGGNASRGREIFFGSAAASCRRCHKINGDGSDVGPDLSEIGKQKARDYLLEAIVDPNAKIAEGFETAVFAMDDGLIHSGIVKKEDAESFQIVTPKGDLVVVEKAHIDDRAKGQSGMPADLPKQITRREIRDLVEFLTTLKEKKEPEGHQ